MAFVASDENVLRLTGCIVPEGINFQEIITINNRFGRKYVLWYNTSGMKLRFVSSRKVIKDNSLGNGSVLCWYSNSRPNEKEICDAYPSHLIVKRGLDANNEENACVGREIFGRSFLSQNERRDLFLKADGRNYSLAELSIERALGSGQGLSANFMRAWLSGAIDIQDINSFRRGECEFCACNRLSDGFKCDMKLGTTFSNVSLYIGDKGEHVSNLSSWLLMETKYAGKIMEMGHVVMVNVQDEVIFSVIDLIRVIRCAHRYVRAKYLNVAQGDLESYADIFDYVIMLVDFTDISRSFLYKLLNTRYGLDQYTMPKDTVVRSFSEYNEWLNKEVMFEGNMDQVFKKMLNLSRLWYPMQ